MLPMHDIMSEKLWSLQLLWDHAAARGGSNQPFNFTWLYPSSREGHVSSIPHDAPLSRPRLAKLQEHAPIDHHFVAPFVLRDEGGRMPVHSSHARIPNPPDQWNMSFIYALLQRPPSAVTILTQSGRRRVLQHRPSRWTLVLVAIRLGRPSKHRREHRWR
jgi:hypothetical protein